MVNNRWVFKGLLLQLSFVALLSLQVTQHQHQHQSQKRYLYSEHQGNLIWGGAMNLAWNELTNQVVKHPITLNTKDNKTLCTLEALNHPVITKQDMDSADYYVKAGFGQETVSTINSEMKKRFGDSSFGSLNVQLQPKDIIAYAYFLKKIKYMVAFHEDHKFRFEGKIVKGFTARSAGQKSNINLHVYHNSDHFLLSIRLKENNTELFLYKSPNKNETFEEVVKLVESEATSGQPIAATDYFGAPEVHFELQRSYSEMTHKTLTNENFTDYSIFQMYQKIKFDMDNKGVRVENMAVIVSRNSRSARRRPPRHKYLILNKPYWIIIKNPGKKPYFVAKINKI